MSVLDLPSMLDWSDPIRLDAYRLCPKGPGIYAIGEPREASEPIVLATEHDAYLGRWPDNFRGLYIGISLSSADGIRGRLRAHARRRGCKGLHSYLDAGSDLYFLYKAGLGATNYEVAYVMLSQPELFPLNQRSELTRNALRRQRALDDHWRAAGREIVDFGAIPDYFEDG